MPLEVQTLDERLFSALGIRSRPGYRPVLSDWVLPVVSIPLQEVGERERDGDTSERRSFAGGATVAAVAVQLAHIGLFNPAGSGIAFFVDRVSVILGVGAASSGIVGLYRRAAPYATLVGVANNKYLGQPTSIAQLRTTSNAVPQQDGGMFDIHATANTRERELIDPPIRVDPGQGLVMINTTLNQQMAGSFEWREYPIPAA